jgi:hypothetical protein
VKGWGVATTAAHVIKTRHEHVSTQGNTVGRIGGEGRGWDEERRERKDRFLNLANRRLTRRPETFRAIGAVSDVRCPSRWRVLVRNVRQHLELADGLDNKA